MSRPSSTARHRLLPGTEVEFLEEDGTVTLRKVKGTRRRGRRLVEHLRGRGTVDMTTDEILALTRDAARYRTYFPGLDLVCPS